VYKRQGEDLVQSEARHGALVSLGVSGALYGTLQLGRAFAEMERRAMADVLGIPFAWPPLGVLMASATVAVLLSIAIGLIGAVVPAARMRRIEPHVLLQSEPR